MSITGTMPILLHTLHMALNRNPIFWTECKYLLETMVWLGRE